MDKTYAETQGKAPFDWNHFLNRAIAGQITVAEEAKAMQLSSRWVTCACGNQCAIIPREGDCCGGPGAPNDEMLKDLGLQFDYEIRACAWRAAKMTLRDIELRADELIRQILAEKNAAQTGPSYVELT